MEKTRRTFKGKTVNMLIKDATIVQNPYTTLCVTVEGRKFYMDALTYNKTGDCIVSLLDLDNEREIYMYASARTVRKMDSIVSAFQV